MMAKLRWHRFEVAVLKKFYPDIEGIEEYKQFLKEITATSNNVFLDFAGNTLDLYEKGVAESNEVNELIMGKEHAEKRIDEQLYRGMTSFQYQYIDRT